MSKLRIAHFVSAFEAGGIQTLVASLARAQAGIDADVWVCALYPERASYKIPVDNQVRYIGFEWHGIHDVGCLGRIKQFLHHNQIQVLHTHPGTLSRLAGILAGVPVIISTLHGSWPASNVLTRAFQRWLAHRTTMFVANSNYTKGYYAALLALDESRFLTIYNGVDLSRFDNSDNLPRREQRSLFDLPSGARVITYIGRLHPDKGVDVLISAARIIINTTPEAHFLIVGEGESRSKLEQQACTIGIGERVRFVGALADVRDALAMTDVFALPSSRREGFGLSLVEAMAMKLPAVATNIGGISEIVTDGFNGLLLKPRDVGALALAITALLNNHELAQQLARNARCTVQERFSKERMIKEYNALYRSLLERFDAHN
jgi:glycosyltransferase involved in cell wall biosynthesis